MTTSSHLLLLLLTATTFLYSAASPPSQHADRIIEAMIGAGDFREWAADFLSAVDDQFGIPLTSTIFIPTDFDSADVNSSRVSIAYHIVPQRLSFTDLHLLRPLSRLPTLLPGNSIVVTNSSVSGFTIDGVLVSEPDLFLSSSVALHGIASPLDASRYGGFGDVDSTLSDSLRPSRRRHRSPRHRRPEPNTDPESNTTETSASVSIELFSIRSVLLPVALAFF